MEFNFLMLSAIRKWWQYYSPFPGRPSGNAFLVYPFESQIGTRLVQDSLSSMFPVSYARWPVFDLSAGAFQKL